MDHIRLETIKPKEMIPGYFGKFIHSENSTLAYWDIKEGYSIPDHAHYHEQIVNVLKGSFELVVEGKSMLLEAGSVVVVPSNIKHSGKSLTDCVIIDVFCPNRKEYNND